MGVHESQSLLWERMVGLSRPFAAYLLPLMREFFPQASLSVWELPAQCLASSWVEREHMQGSRCRAGVPVCPSRRLHSKRTRCAALRCARHVPPSPLAPPRQPANCCMPALAQLPKEQTPEDLYAALNIIKEPSMIRVEADEVR